MTQSAFFSLISRYCVLALGSRAYPKFCAFGKQLDASLSKLGASSFLELTLCDQTTAPEATFNSWLGRVRDRWLTGMDSFEERVQDTVVERKKSRFRKVSVDKREFYNGMDRLL